MKPNGFLIHEGTKNGEKYAVIATLKTSQHEKLATWYNYGFC